MRRFPTTYWSVLQLSGISPTRRFFVSALACLACVLPNSAQPAPTGDDSPATTPWRLDGEVGLELDQTLVGLADRWPDGLPVVGRADSTAVRGDLRVGVRHPGFAAYGALSGAADLAGQPALRVQRATRLLELDVVDDLALHPRVVHPHGGAFGFVHLAWAQLDGFGDGGLARKMSLRAGRQSHWGPRPITFDGAKVGLDGESLTVQVYGGRRAGVYAIHQPDPGLVGGARLLVELDRDFAVPLTLRAEYQVLQRTIDLDPIGAFRHDAAFTPAVVDRRLGLGELALYCDLDRDLLVELRVDLLDVVPSHLRAGVRWQLGTALLTVDLDQKLGEDAPYDLAAGRSHTFFDPRTREIRPSTFEVLRLNMPDRADYTDVRARLTVEVAPNWAIEPYGGTRIVQADDIVASPWDADTVDFGLSASGALRLTPTAGLELEFTYDGTLYDRSATGDLPLLDDVAAGPEGDRHAVGAGLRYVAVNTPTRGRRLLTDRWLTAGVWASYARYGFGSRYLDNESEEVLAVKVDGTWRFANRWTVGTRYEYARDATLTFAHLGNIHLARVRVAVGW